MLRVFQKANLRTPFARHSNKTLNTVKSLFSPESGTVSGQIS
jgi:hypothetical protein